MKRYLTILVLCTAVGSMNSCTREYNCECTSQASIENYSTNSSMVKAMTKRGAERKCDDQEGPYTYCSIK